MKVSRPRAILAGSVIGPGGRPIENGGIAWSADRIGWVGSRAEILRLRPRILADDPRGILMPGLINSHAHLELSGLAGKIPPGTPYTDWLLEIIHQKKRLTARQVVRAIQAGERRLIFSGVTAVADVSSFPAGDRTRRALRTRILPELIGLKTDVAIPNFASLSPHAPYSLSDRNLDRIASWWNRHPRAILSMHIAESRDEGNYFSRGEGAFHQFYQQLGLAPRSVPRRRVLAHLDRHHLLRYGMVAVHANDVSLAEAKLLAGRGIAVAVCPGSIDYFGFSPAGVRRLLEARVPVMFGTDSAASNADLNLFRELRLAAKFWNLPPRVLIDSATRLPGDRWWDSLAGRLAPGSYADVLLVDRAGKTADPYADLLTGRAEDRIRMRILAGRKFDKF